MPRLLSKFKLKVFIFTYFVLTRWKYKNKEKGKGDKKIQVISFKTISKIKMIGMP